MSEIGQINIHTENIFPIIKKAVYSDHEIFLRELVSNSVDAISKRKLATRCCTERTLKKGVTNKKADNANELDDHL